jgi:peptidoglycan hydrolase-like protein with peptidoglycan-binding domain
VTAGEANTVRYGRAERVTERVTGPSASGRERPAGYGNYQWLSPGSRTLRLKDAGDDVKFLQRHIGVEPDGYFGPETARALAAFREQQGLGGADGATATGDPADPADVVAGRDVWAAVLGTTNPLHRTRRRWRLGGDPRMVRR